MAAAALKTENADLVTRDGDVDLTPVALGDARPRDQHALVREGAGRVLEGAELGDAAGALELALVVVLLGEGEKETFLAVGGGKQGLVSMRTTKDGRDIGDGDDIRTPSCSAA